jgi:hypothetical protein
MTEWKQRPTMPIEDKNVNKFNLYVYTIINGKYVNMRHFSKKMPDEQDFLTATRETWRYVLDKTDEKE